jgi:group I intron endonuclease
MEKICGIYSITCTSNVAIYVGQSRDIRTRWACHRSELKKGIHDNGYMQNCWNKYGSESFSFAILEEVELSRLTERECFWIEKLSASLNLYVPDASGVVLVASLQTRDKISMIAKDRYAKNLANGNNYLRSPEAVMRQAESRIGNKHSEETRAKISAANKQRYEKQIATGTFCMQTLESKAKREATRKEKSRLRRLMENEDDGQEPYYPGGYVEDLG